MNQRPEKLLVVSASETPGYVTFLAVDGLSYVKHEKSLSEMIEFAGAVQQAIVQAIEKLDPAVAATVSELFASQPQPDNVVQLRSGTCL